MSRRIVGRSGARTARRGGAVWRGRTASRISVSSWRTRDAHGDIAIAKLRELQRAAGAG
ncbi:hypothetical protein ACLBKU_16395 [Erythrobacter sp. NE805]|uniref:hypothetical protein n=1 Tax=Erythrobacter sp. NE805 TaxID=3389875 RepID=UPI00396AF623